MLKRSSSVQGFGGLEYEFRCCDYLIINILSHDHQEFDGSVRGIIELDRKMIKCPLSKNVMLRM